MDEPQGAVLSPAFEDVQKHYDLSDDFFALFLDRTRTVTTGGGVSQSHVTEYVNDVRFGLPKQVTNTGNGVVNFRYDSYGRIVKAWTSLDTEALPTTCYQYYFTTPVIVGRFQREVSGLGEACGTSGMIGAASFFDGLGRTIERKTESSEPGYLSVVTDALAFNDEGRISEAKDPFFSTGQVLSYEQPAQANAGTTFQYDEVGRRTLLTSPGVAPVAISYSGWTITQLDPGNRKTEADVDGFGREIQRRKYDDNAALLSSSDHPASRLTA